MDMTGFRIQVFWLDAAWNRAELDNLSRRSTDVNGPRIGAW